MRARITPRSNVRIPHRAGLPVLLALIVLIGVPRTGFGQGYLQGHRAGNADNRITGAGDAVDVFPARVDKGDVGLGGERLRDRFTP